MNGLLGDRKKGDADAPAMHKEKKHHHHHHHDDAPGNLTLTLNLNRSHISYIIQLYHRDYCQLQVLPLQAHWPGSPLFRAGASARKSKQILPYQVTHAKCLPTTSHLDGLLPDHARLSITPSTQLPVPILARHTIISHKSPLRTEELSRSLANHP